MVGIKETGEALVGVNEVALVLVKQLKDGLQVSDFEVVFQKVVNDVEFKAKLQAAYEGISLVPSEVKDLDLYEAGQLAMVQISYVPKLIEALKA